MGLRIRGYEKAWMALAGLSVPVTTGALWLVSLSDAVPAPPPESISAAVVAAVATLFACFGAFIAANSKPEGQAEIEQLAAQILRQSASDVAIHLREPVKPASEPEVPPPQPSILAVQPLRPEPRKTERMDGEDERATP